MNSKDKDMGKVDIIAIGSVFPSMRGVYAKVL